jgi:undecaprenyl-diphosphatase
MRRWREVLGRAALGLLALFGAWLALCAVFGAVVFVLGTLLEGPVHVVDRGILWALYELRVDTIVAVTRRVSFLGRPEVTLPLLLIGAIGLFLLRERRGAVQVLVTYMGAGNVYLALAPIFHRPRPRYFPDIPFAEGWAMPSGHVVGALGVALPVAIAVARRWPDWARAAAITAIAYVALVAVTRVYLQMHHVTDVVAAMLATGAWYLVSDALLGRVWDYRRRAAATGGAGANGTTSAERPPARESGAPADDVAGSSSGRVGSLRRV